MSNNSECLYGEDGVLYRHVTSGYVSTINVEGRSILKIDEQALPLLSEVAFRDVSFMLRKTHLEQIAAIVDDPEASSNDRFVAKTLLQNAAIAVKGQLPLCQDTGTAIVIAEKGECVWTGTNDSKAIAEGILRAYQNNNLRYSQTIAKSMCGECNSGNNMPAQVDIHAVEGDQYKFIFIAKGGGSANKTMLFQETKALLVPDRLESFLLDKICNLGTSACPPYHVAIVVGGTSAEENLRMVKLASAKCLDSLPTSGDDLGGSFRDVELEQRLLQKTQQLGLGAQFGGKYFALDVRVVRLSRHGASCPVGIGVSCVADRNIKAIINGHGLWIEQLEQNPARFLSGGLEADKFEGKKLDLDRPMSDILANLNRYAIGTQLLLSGTIVVARDIAHARLKERLDRGDDLPEYLKNHPVYYAGPAKTPSGMPSGSFGPTTAGRMDAYIEQFQQQGACLVTIAKGNRGQVVTDCCKRFGGFYLGSIGGAAAVLAHDCIKSVRLIEFPELGMEAIYQIQVENFPAFVLVDNKGNSFYDQILENREL